MTLRIFFISFYNLLRARWLWGVFVAFAAATWLFTSFADTYQKAIISTLNLVLLVVSLIAALISAMHYYNSRDFTILLLTQPVSRTAVFYGQLWGFTAALSAAFLLGVGLPLLLFGAFWQPEAPVFVLLLIVGLFVIAVFASLSHLICLRFADKVKGIGFTLFLWLFFAAGFDLLMLGYLQAMSDYPVEQHAMVLSFFNPLDLSRILVMLRLDISALMGVTGAVFKKYFSSELGAIISGVALLIWVLIPQLTGVWLARRRDY
jgi:Cu-processing system permease protein